LFWSNIELSMLMAFGAVAWARLFNTESLGNRPCRTPTQLLRDDLCYRIHFLCSRINSLKSKCRQDSDPPVSWNAHTETFSS
jgi:hypothetical protein